MGNVSILVRIRILIVAILVATIYPLVIVFCFVPIYILRYVTSLLKRLLRPDLGKLLTARSCIFAVDDLYKQPLSTLVGIMTLEGQLTIETLRTSFRERVLQGHKNETSLSHPEFHHFSSTWMGFPVWVPEHNFSLDHHIKPYDGPVLYDLLTESVCFKIADELVTRPFIAGKSPWEMYVLPNYQVDGDPNPEIPKTVMMLRSHHCLADGLSLVNLMTKLGMVQTLPSPNYPKRGFLTTCLYFVTFVLRIPYDLATMMVLNSDPLGPWYLPQSQLAPAVDNAFSFSPKIPSTFIKTIRETHKVTTTGVLMTVITGALRRIMVESGKGVPESITMITALPVPGHPDKMRNHMTAVVLSLPIGIEDPLDRLRIIERSMKSLRKSTLPTTLFYLGKIFGALYPTMTRFFGTHRAISLIFSNFPGTSPQARFLDLPILDSLFFGGMTPGIGMGANAVISNGNLRMALAINAAILPNGDLYLQGFKDHIRIELDNLLISY